MTNFLKKLCFVVCSSNPTESTPRQEGKPSAECKENIESQIASGVIESSKSQGIDSGSVCARSGASRDSLSASDSNLSKTNCDENIESKESLESSLTEI